VFLDGDSRSSVVWAVNEGFILDHRIRQFVLLRRTVVRRYLWTKTRSEDNVGREVLLRILSCYLTGSTQSHVRSCSLILCFLSLTDSNWYRSFVGFCAVNSIVGGQVLQAVNPGELSTTVGIVIIAVVSMIISFFGYRVLHACERWACESS